ncbi:hypothetical protein V6N13_043434 [Hibiscus sabdariffa]
MKLDKRANEDATNMGLFNNPKSTNLGKTKSNEEKKPVQQNRSLPETHIEKEFEEAIPKIEEEVWTSSPEEEENYNKAERAFFLELESKKDTSKRYGSLIFLQDKVITEVDKKKKDRAIRREKKKSKGRVS